MRRKELIKRAKRVVSVLVASSLVLSIPLPYNVLQTTEIVKTVSAHEGEINTAWTISKIEDSNLRAYVFEKAKAAGYTGAANSLTIVDARQYLTNAELVLPSNVNSLTGLGLINTFKSLDCSSTSVTSIDDYEFNECHNLVSITLPTSLTTMGDYAFNLCESLKDINLSNIQSVGAYAFFGCAALSNASVATLPSSVTKLGIAAFSGCSSLTSVSIPQITGAAGKGRVPAQLFNNCSYLRNVRILDTSLKNIDELAFAKTGTLKFALGATGSYADKLPSTLESIGASAFLQSDIISIDLSLTKLKRIENYCFRGAYLFGNDVMEESVKLPDTLTSIGEMAFGSTMMQKIVIPDSVTTLESQCFRYNNWLQDIKLSTSIKEIPEYAFSLESSLIEPNYEGIDAESGYRFSGVSVSFNEGKTPALETIKDYGFWCTKLINVDGSSLIKSATKLKNIGNYAFVLNAFEKIDFPDSIETIGDEGFAGSSELVYVNFNGNKIKELPSGCFGVEKQKALNYGGTTNTVNKPYNCPKLKEVKLPSSLEVIGEFAFATDNSLDTVYTGSKRDEGTATFPDGLKSIGKSAFNGCASYVSSEGGYPDAPTGIKKVIIPDSCNALGENVFEGCFSIEEAYLGDGLEEIPNFAFADCAVYKDGKVETKENEGNVTIFGLKKVKLPASIKKIGNDAFAADFALEGFIINNTVSCAFPSSLESIGNEAFNTCKSMDKISFGPNLKSIGSSAFSDSHISYTDDYGITHNIKGISSVDFSMATGLTDIGSNAFSNTLIKNITFPSALTSLSNNICYNCHNLTTVSVGENVTSIGQGAFGDCENLSSLTLPFYATWDRNTFGDKSSKTGLYSGSITINSRYKKTIDGKSNPYEEKAIIVDKTEDGTLNCFKNFSVSEVSMAITDKDKDSADESNNLLTHDSNDYISVTREQNSLTFKGKKKGETDIRITSTIILPSGMTLNAIHDFHVIVRDNLVTKIEFESGKIDKVKETKDDEEIERNILYLPVGGYAENVIANLTAEYIDKELSDDISWSLDQTGTDIVSLGEPVNDYGNLKSTMAFTPLKAGNTTVTVQGRNSVSKKDLEVKVVVPASSMKFLDATKGISFTNKTLDVDDFFTLKLEPVYSEENQEVGKEYPDKYEISTSDDSVVSIDENNKIKGVAPGTATIYAKGKGTGQSFSFSITVQKDYVETPVSRIKFNSENVKAQDGGAVLFLSVGGSSATVTGELVPENESGVLVDDVKWEIVGAQDVVSLGTVSNNYTGKTTSMSISPLKSGETRIKVYGSKDGSEAYLTVKVCVPARKVELVDSSTGKPAASNTLDVGKTVQLKVNITYDDADKDLAALYPDEYEFTSSDNSIATVDATGKVTTLADGKVTITATSKYTGKSTSVSYTVKKGYKPDVTEVKLSSDKLSMKRGETVDLKATVSPADADQTVTWSTSDEKKATVNNGVVTALAAGSVTITAKAGSKSATCSITITSPAKSLRIRSVYGNTKVVYTSKGSTFTLSKFYSNDDCTDTFKFTCNKKKVATVTDDGSVTTLRPGRAKVTVTAYDKDEKKTSSASINLVVLKRAKKAKRLARIKGGKSVKVDGKRLLMAVTKPKNATTSITWSSKDTSIATVDETGVVTGVKKGVTVITATTESGRKKSIKIRVS